MRKFILKSLAFMLIVLIGTHIRHLIYKGKYQQTVAGSEVYYSLFKSKQKKKTKKLLLGDSVGYQLFPNTTSNDQINSLACNQAISMVGQFVLLNNYINAGNKIDTVIMIFTPFSFMNNLNQIYTYHYFLKPFYKKEYLNLFSETVNKQIQKIPYVSVCRVPYILESNWAPEFKSKDEINYTFLSPISVEYLIKIKALAFKNHFRLIIIPPPTSFSKKLAIEKMNKNEIVKNNLCNEFRDYFKRIKYLSDKNFSDGTHLKKPEEYREYYEDIYLKNKPRTVNKLELEVFGDTRNEAVN